MRNITRKILLCCLFFNFAQFVTWSAYADDKPAADLTGRWSFEEEVLVAGNGCADRIGSTEKYYIVIQQDGNELMGGTTGGEIKGSIKGRKVKISAKIRTPDGRVLQNTLNGKLSKKCDVISGISKWRLNNLTSKCTGMLKFSATPDEDIECTKHEKSAWQKFKESVLSVLGLG